MSCVILVTIPAAECLQLRTPSLTHRGEPPYSQAKAEETVTQTCLSSHRCIHVHLFKVIIVNVNSAVLASYKKELKGRDNISWFVKSQLK